MLASIYQPNRRPIIYSLTYCKSSYCKEWHHFFLRHPGNYRKRGSGKKVCIIDRIPIDKRPAEVAAKSRFGDWEIDTVYCSTGPEVLVTIVERKSKYTLISKLPSRHALKLAKRTGRLLKPYIAHTITADNGTEFAAHKRITRLTGATVYFAHPYCSFERGLNENTNGLIRQYIPKNRSGKHISLKEIKRIQEKLNHRPRKSLDFHTPAEVFLQKSNVALQT